MKSIGKITGTIAAAVLCFAFAGCLQFGAQTATVTNDENTLGITATSVSSSAETIATAAITSNGVVITSAGEGSATLTCKDANDNTATIAVVVGDDGYIFSPSITKYSANGGVWKFDSTLGALSCEAVNASTALLTDTALQAATTAYTSFDALSTAAVKFHVKSDVTYTATSGLKMTIKSLYYDDTSTSATYQTYVPIQYNKFQEALGLSTNFKDTTGITDYVSDGELDIKKDALIISDVQEPFTVYVAFAANSSSDKTDRYGYVKVGTGTDTTTYTTYTDATYNANNTVMPAAGYILTQAVSGTDKVNVVVGATNFARVYQVTIVY